MTMTSPSRTPGHDQSSQGTPTGQTHPLHPAYAATDYHVGGPHGRFTLRVGQPQPQLDELLRERQAATWAYLSAHNPGSIIVAAAQNDNQHQKLVSAVAGQDWTYLQGEAVAPDGTWPAEKSVLILGPSQEQAHQLAIQFGQLAFLFGAHGGPVQLIWTEEYNNACPGNLEKTVQSEKEKQ
jgi:hypothetical protein